jgi:outer membrane protein insertion porin family
VRAALLTAVSAIAIVSAAERSVTVTDVRIEGTHTVHPDRIRFVTTVRAGRDYGVERELPLALADDVRAIERMGPFTDTRTEVKFGDDPTKVTVVIRVTELPYVTEIAFTGLDDAGWGADSDLKKKMETKVGGYANPLIVENDLRAIERHFRDKGHRGALARATTVPVPGGVALHIAIDLPPAVQVGRVFYRGLPDGMRHRRLDELLDRTQVNRPGRPWQPEMMEIDRGDVVRAIQDEGWLDCRLKGVDAEYTDFVRPLEERRRNGPEFVPDGAYDDRVHIVYDLDAGRRYRLGSVSFVGNTVAGGDELRTAFTMAEGDWFRRNDVTKAIERARRVISNRGYARCRFSPDRRINFETNTVDLVIRVDEGKQYRIGRIDIHGNEITRDSVLRRAIQLRPGELWNDDAVDESRRQILRGGLFKDDPRRPLTLLPDFPADRPDEADLVIDVDEESSGSLQVQLGYSSSTGIFGEFSYTERNFDLIGALTDPGNRWRGGGQILDLSVNWAQSRNSVSASWTDPALADGPYSFGLSGSRSDSSQRDWDEVRVSGGTSVGRNFLKNDLKLGLSYNYTDIRVKDVNTDAPDDALPGSYYMNTLGLSLTWDRLDNVRLPTSGWLVSASESLSGGIVSATTETSEYALKGDGFLPLLESDDGGVTFLHLGARWRQAFAIDGADRVPFYQRYLGGGPAPRHRGFAYNDLGPTAINQNGFKAREGGDRDLVATAELTYPLQGYNEGVCALVFTDVGNVWAEKAKADISELRVAWGFGVRFPMQFPISLDFAWLVDPKQDEASTQVHFGLGQMRF